MPSQVLITGTFSSSINSYVFISRMFVTSISKSSNFIYLSWTFQLNEGFSRGGIPCACLGSSISLGVLAADLGPIPVPSSLLLQVDSHLDDYCLNAFRFCHFSLIFQCLSASWSNFACLVWDFYSWHHVMLLPLNVITLMQFLNLVYCLHILQLCIKYEYLQCTLLHVHAYTQGTLKVWPTHARRLDPISQLSG